MDGTLTQIFQEVINLTLAIERAKQELEDQDKRIKELEEKLSGIEPSDH